MYLHDLKFKVYGRVCCEKVSLPPCPPNPHTPSQGHPVLINSVLCVPRGVFIFLFCFFSQRCFTLVMRDQYLLLFPTKGSIIDTQFLLFLITTPSFNIRTLFVLFYGDIIRGHAIIHLILPPPMTNEVVPSLLPLQTMIQ